MCLYTCVCNLIYLLWCFPEKYPFFLPLFDQRSTLIGTETCAHYIHTSDLSCDCRGPFSGALQLGRKRMKGRTHDKVVSGATVIGQKFHHVVWRKVFRMLVYKFYMREWVWADRSVRRQKEIRVPFTADHDSIECRVSCSAIGNLSWAKSSIP